MNRGRVVLLTAAAAAVVFAVAAFLYKQQPSEAPAKLATEQSDSLVRPHAPVIGPKDAKVTIVEFFDPACESCRAMYPVVKSIMAEYPKDVRLVMRYAAFHDGSEEAVRILETARLQGRFEPVVEALLAAQPQWADHSGARLELAWSAASAAGLDIAAAQKESLSPAIDAVLAQDRADVDSLGVDKTPTFFVNGKPLPSFGIEELKQLVRSEVEASR